MKKLTALAMVLFLLLPNMAFAEEAKELKTLTKKYEFETTNHEFEYEPPNEVKQDGITYRFKSIEYEELNREDLFIETEEVITKEVVKENMRKQDSTFFEEVISVDDADFKGDMELKEVSFTESLIEDRKTTHTHTYAFGTLVIKPKPSPTLEVLYHDDETDTDILAELDFVKLTESNPHWTDNIHVEQIFRSIYGDEYLLNDGTRLSFLSEKPEYIGIEASLLTQMRLNETAYRIVDSKWLGETKTESGQTSRTAEYIVQRQVKNYSGIYNGTFALPNILTFDGHAVYEAEKITKLANGRNYKVKAIVTYEQIPIKENKKVAPIVAGTTGGVIGLCGLVVFLIKKRKNDEESI